MKFLTPTADGGYVVEMTQREVREFRNLIQAVEGKTITDVYDFAPFENRFYQESNVEISDALAAVRSFYGAQFRVNEIEKGYLILKSAVFPDKKGQ